MEPLVTSKIKDKVYRSTFDSAYYFTLLTALYEQSRSEGADYTQLLLKYLGLM